MNTTLKNSSPFFTGNGEQVKNTDQQRDVKWHCALMCREEGEPERGTIRNLKHKGAIAMSAIVRENDNLNKKSNNEDREEKIM